MSRLAFADLLLRDAAALLIIKATVVLALASCAAAALQGLSAARRHMLWLVALASCVWLVVSSPLVPAMTIHAPMLAQSVVIAAPRPTAVAHPSSTRATTAASPEPRARFANTEGVRRASLTPIPLASHPLIALWIIGCVVLLARHAIGFVGAVKLARRASIDDNHTGELATAGVRRQVRLGYSADVQTPVTFGVVTPVILLPTEARSWSIERRRAVLVHESAHIARGDWLSQAVGRLACDLFWFHPLAWRAFGLLRDEAERAADDCVLRSGMPVCEYATHLLEIARRRSDTRPNLVAVGIVSTNRLEQRFVAMLDSRRSRATVTSRARVMTTSVALVMVCPLASLHVAAPATPLRVARNALSPQHIGMPVAPHTAGAQTLTSNTSPVSHTATVHAPDVPSVSLRPPTPPSITVVSSSTPSGVATAHPDFSGKWRQDTVASPTMDIAVTDSSIITQSENAISALSRGHTPTAVTREWFPRITFDGAMSAGMTVMGVEEVFVLADAAWAGDTLVITTHFQGRRHFRTVERLTLSPDRQTLFSTSTSFVDGDYLWLRGQTSVVLRRMTE
jgi:beta-lactamase regulating signal transducer with metallopeptidase domain